MTCVPAHRRTLARVQADQHDLLAELFQLAPVLPVLRIVDERAQIHLVPRRQMAQQMVRADLVPLVRRERDAVDQKQQT